MKSAYILLALSNILLASAGPAGTQAAAAVKSDTKLFKNESLSFALAGMPLPLLSSD
jgi:hypothetical protein